MVYNSSVVRSSSLLSSCVHNFNVMLTSIYGYKRSPPFCYWNPLLKFVCSILIVPYKAEEKLWTFSIIYSFKLQLHSRPNNDERMYLNILDVDWYTTRLAQTFISFKRREKKKCILNKSFNSFLILHNFWFGVHWPLFSWLHFSYQGSKVVHNSLFGMKHIQ